MYFINTFHIYTFIIFVLLKNININLIYIKYE